MNSMDLNLYLGLPLSQLPRTPDLGSDLALGSSSSSDLPIGESPSGTVADMSTFRDLSDGNQIPYSPSNPESASVDVFVADLDFQPVREIDGDLGRNTDGDNPVVLDRVEPYLPADILFDRDGRSSSRHDDRLTPAAYRFGTLIQSNHPVRDRSLASRRFRASLPYIGEQSSNVSSLQVAASTAVCAGDSIEKSSKNKKNDYGVDKEDLTEESEEQSGAIAGVNFECNICFELASDPVVTSCGHLFCWPCLYLWLHQYSDHKECPACKGQVNESNIIPIYGRGCSSEVNNAEKDSDPGNLKIPQKPHGHRIESTRQQRATLRRSAVVEGVFDPFRHILSDMSQLEGLLDPSLSHFTGRSDQQQQQHDQPNESGRQERSMESSAMQQLIDHRRMMTRLRARRLLRMPENQEMPSIPNHPVSTTATTAAAAAAIGIASRIPTSLSSPSQVTNTMTSSDPHVHYSSGMSASERLTAVHSDLMRLVSRFARNSVPPSFMSEAVPPVVGRNNQNNSQVIFNTQLTSGGGAHSTSTNTTTDQASASSSTMAIIQGDSPPAPAVAAAVIGTSAEPNIAGTSRSTSSRRRGRSTASCLADNNGSVHDNKRRRSN